MNKNTRHHIQMAMLVVAAVLFVIAVYHDMGLIHAISACVVSLVFLSGMIYIIYGDNDW